MYGGGLVAVRRMNERAETEGCGKLEPSWRDRIEDLAASVLAEEGFELVEAKMNLRGRRRTLTFFIDRPAGNPDASVLLDDCARVSRMLESALDDSGLMEGRYVLEVSSPGLDRLLRGEKDFVRFQGERARVTTRHPIEKQEFFQGILGEVREGILSLELDSGKRVQIPLTEISTARLEVVF
jgi:ribosome maturation factor RimP